MKTSVFGILLFISSMSAFSQTSSGLNPVLTSDYRSLPVPQMYEGYIYYVDSTFMQSLVSLEEIPRNKDLLKSFPNLVSTVTIFEVNQNGELSVAGVGISAKNKIYEVIYDFSQTQTLIFDGEKSTEAILVGVGVRMIAKIQTKQAGINLSSPISLAASSSKIVGSLEVRVIGANSSKINDLIPTPSDLSPASISIALQSVATIKSHLSDNDTVIIPQFLAYNKIDKTGGTNITKATQPNQVGN